MTRRYFMTLLASMRANLGAATGTAVALLMATTVFLATPDRPTITLQTLAMASRPSAVAAMRQRRRHRDRWWASSDCGKA
jgi:hypothetical protein